MKKRLLFFLVGVVGLCSLLPLFAKRRRNPEKKADKTAVVSSDAEKKSTVGQAVVAGSVVPGFNEKAYSESRRAIAESLVQKGIAYLQKHDEATAFNAFTYSPDFNKSGMYLFVYSLDGVCLAIGQYRNMLWQNLYDYQDAYGTYVVRSIIDQAKKGSGWITYEWKNVTKLSYVANVKKGNKTYAIGCGFYPHSKRDSVVSLVNGAVSYFNEVQGRGGTVGEAFSRFNYSMGNFVLGDLYLYALDFDGVIRAQGDRPGLIGQNALQYQDSNGKYVNKEVIKMLQKADNGVWIEYESKRAPKMAYARKVTDKKGKEYFIACGYYPTADRDAVVDLVRRGDRYLEMHGVTKSVDEFTSKRKDNFRFGDLYLFVYDPKGKVIAHGGNPDYVGTSHWDLTDDDGKYFVQYIIEKAQAGGGWLDYKVNNMSRFVYVEEVELGKRKFIVGSGLHPISKPETMQLLVKGGVSLLQDSSKEVAFGEFVKRGGDFVKGDLTLFAFDSRGICYAYGQEENLIWRNMSRAQDDDGKPFVKNLIKTAQGGPDIMTFNLGGAEKVAYVEKVEKDGIMFVVGSSFYK